MKLVYESTLADFKTNGVLMSQSFIKGYVNKHPLKKRLYSSKS